MVRPVVPAGVVQIASNGGNGGAGGTAADQQTGNGGNGGNGANSTNITATFADSRVTQIIVNGTGPALVVSTTGGSGGGGGAAGTYGYGGTSGTGGTAGNITVNFGTSQGNVPATIDSKGSAPAIVLSSLGGSTGDAGWGTRAGLKSIRGPSAGAAGSGGAISATINASVSNGITAVSQGGSGGAGGQAISAWNAYGGNGGAGGAGGDIALNLVGGNVATTGAATFGTGATSQLDSYSNPKLPVTVTTSVVTAAISALSLGGLGGKGGDADGGFGFASDAGSGGVAGAGGQVNVSVTSTESGDPVIATKGYGAVGIAALSVGGEGGDGAEASSMFRSTGGNGAAGGNADIVSVNLGDAGTGHQLITTSGAMSDAVVAMSVGGGGGYGGDVQGGSIGYSATLGGHGANGGNGGQVQFLNGGYWNLPTDGGTPSLLPGYVISTTGNESRGLSAMSVGGGGGRGGSAFSATFGLVALGIGGYGGQGGDGGRVTAQNYGIIQTTGKHSTGMDAQSIGGGGGTGGAATSLAANFQFTASVAVGGTGGSGGVGGSVEADNLQQILTFGSDSYGIRAQSVGGGGGDGGATVAAALQSAATSEIPSISLAVSLGGNGGKGGEGGPVETFNAGLLGTSGAGSSGILAQSIGGGGGTGGDSSALQTAYDTASINVSTAIGGKGGSGGVGGAVTAYNSGLLFTLGDDAAGIKAQSIGGGGGNGGYGKINAGGYNSASGPSVTATVAIGGSGGSGGDSGNVSVYNYANSTLLPAGTILPQGVTPDYYGSGAILTMGDGSNGIMAQAIGGGGGSGGNAIAKGSGGNITVNVAVGGTGGAGGNGGQVTVDNGAGAILTTGANANGIFAQSIGGGGGTGGRAATGSGADPLYALADYIGNNMAQALGKDPAQTVEQVGDDIWQWKAPVTGAYSTLDSLQQIADGYTSANAPLAVPVESKASTSDLTVNIGGGWGGKGGSAGNGGAITVTNAGSIQTDGPMSMGIFAESVGGGGGGGGAANPSTSNDKLASTTVSGSIAVGGAGGSGGSGGTVTVSNGGIDSSGKPFTGNIYTEGDLSMGIVAQSIGGGGGIGGVTAATTGGGSSFKVAVGGTTGAWGPGGTVFVTTSGNISTGGNSAYGVLAQSIGGGGGLGTVMGQNFNDKTGGSDSVISALTVSVSPSFVGVEQPSGNIFTNGRNASGIVAQSIGAGGGIIATEGNFNNLSAADVFSNIAGGDRGGSVIVQQSPGASIVTQGDGAAGIVAQSLAGGGIIQGLDGVDLQTPTQRVNAYSGSTGGSAEVDVYTPIATYGAYAPGVFAQSSALGGVAGGPNGSGFTFAAKSQQSGGQCSPTCLGAVTVNMYHGGDVVVSGAHSFGVAMLAQGNNGSGLSATTLNMFGGAQILAQGNAAGAVFLGGDNANTVAVDGAGTLIDGSQTATGLAIGSWSSSPAVGHISTSNGGTIKGSIVLGDGSTLNNGPLSTIESGAQINLGSHGLLTNNGTLNVGGAGTIATTAVTGNFVQGSSGTLQVDANSSTGQADLLAVNGTADVGGTVELNSSTLSSKPLTVLTATGGVTIESTLQSPAGTYLYSYRTSVVGNSVEIQPQADFTAAASGLTSSDQRLAAHLQQIWDSGSDLNGGFAALKSLTGPQALGAALSSITGAAVRGVEATKQASSERFFDNLVSCQAAPASGAGLFQEDDCGWVRVMGNHTDLSSTDDEPGYEQNSLTYQAGGQREVSPGWFVGGSLGLESSWLNGDGANVSGRTGLAGLMIKHQMGPWMLTGELDGSYGTYDSTRSIVAGSQSGTASASPTVSQVGTYLRGAYQTTLTASTYVEPSLTVGAHYTQMGQYNESGSTSFNLNVHDSGNLVYSANPMVEFGMVGNLAGIHPMRAFVDVGAAAYTNSNWRGDASLEDAPAGTGTFGIDSRLPSVVAKVKAGVDVYARDRLDVKISYGADLASGFVSQSALAKVTYTF
ncbi:MAG TPA: hypothetical protein VNX02_17745 [Steroidobacteraceae bacterium]|jgi:hypothetical protein|nr:hypothetical protein [Steroidobacteraceae bacterium]